jgi:hypothetical protein
MSFIIAIALAAMVIPPDGYQPALVLAGVAVYLVGLAVHATVGRRTGPTPEGQGRPPG